MARKSRATLAPAPPRQLEIQTAGVIAALLVLVFAIYAQVRTHPFILFDDPLYVSANDHVLAGLTWNSVKWAFTHIHAAYWIPLTWISHMIDVQMFGRNAGAHLLVSVALHAINSVLVFLFLRMATRAMWRSAAVAALFAVHPLHVESVAWVSERKDTLSTLFFSALSVGIHRLRISTFTRQLRCIGRRLGVWPIGEADARDHSDCPSPS